MTRRHAPIEPPSEPASEDPLAFAALRPRLVRLARGRVGGDAEDVVHDAWLRWHDAGRARPDDAGAWLAAVVMRLCIDRLRHARVEALHAGGSAGDAGAAPSAESLVADAHAVREALADALRRLSALEAAAWLLREVLDADYDELAGLLARSDAACRQLVHRARERLRRRESTLRAGTEQPVLEACLRAIRSADRRALVAALLASQPETVGRDRVHDRIRCERRAGIDGLLVVLGDVVLAVVPVDGLESVDVAAIAEA